MKKAALWTLVLILCLFTRAEAVSGTAGEWTPDGYYSDVTLYGMETDENGQTVLLIESPEPNDARWIQTIEVEPDCYYCLSVLIRAEGCDPFGCGANLSVLNSEAVSSGVIESDGEWIRQTLYGYSGQEQTELVAALRLGGYGRITEGKAWFKDFSITEQEPPAGAEVFPFATYEPWTGDDDTSGGWDWEPYEEEKTLPDRRSESVTLYTFILCLLFLAVYTGQKRHKREMAKNRFTPGGWLGLVLILLVSGALHVYMALKVRGYRVDMNCFMAWSEAFADSGTGTYATGMFCDYPPVYMLLLGALGKLREALNIAYDSPAHWLLIKSIPIFCDLFMAGCVFFLSAKKTGCKRALLLTAAVAFCPAFLIDSAAWGQVDSVLTLLLCVCVALAMRGRWEFALPVYALGVLTKPQALMFGPIGLIALAADFIRRESSRKRAIIGLAAAAAVLYGVCLPFSLKDPAALYKAAAYRFVVGPFVWIWERLFGAVNGYRYITVNACNLYVLLGKNWQEMGADGWTIVSYAALAAAYVYAGMLCVMSRGKRNLPLCGAVLLALIFAFAPMMHERYLFPALALSMLAYLECRDRRLLLYFIVNGCTLFLNIYLVLVWGGTEGFEVYGHLQGSEHLINGIVSAVNVVSAVYLAAVGGSIVFTKKAKKLMFVPDLTNHKTDHRLGLRRRDYILMAAVTLVYGVTAFLNLGVTKAPQNAWKNTRAQEQVVFDLGEKRTYRMTYYHGITGTRFTAAFSNDGENWTEENYAAVSEGSMYTWIWYVPCDRNGEAIYREGYYGTGSGDAARVNYCSGADNYPLQTSRYIRLTTLNAGLVLNEVAFLNPSDGSVYPIVSVSGSVEGASYAALCDEQDTVCAVPSYLNGMYFDEIYHARTAYELNYDVRPILEWSHPHLGKLIIGLGIRIFGMTPFGWRFMGALFGTLMLPLMYLLVKQLTGRSELSFAGMMLLALDSMHFTQTRIATVDTYAVFFIMLMYLFMIRYFQMSLRGEKWAKSLIPLGLCGITMGLACASKWTGIYASAGLAVIFFIKLMVEISRFRREKGREGGLSAARFSGRIAITLAFCIVFFVAVPVLIYYACYIAHFSTDVFLTPEKTGITPEKVWKLQQDMFNYHSGLVDDHYFKSPWYEWPVVGKPMWYYSASTAYVGKGFVSSISCMGNPAVWWVGLAALIIGLILLVTRPYPGSGLLLAAIGFAAEFLPWTGVPRSTFIYHYFASVPFIILFTVLLIGKLADRGKWGRHTAFTISCVILCAAMALFVMFYPLESGAVCSYDYAMKLRWFDWYNFALQ